MDLELKRLKLINMKIFFLILSGLAILFITGKFLYEIVIHIGMDPMWFWIFIATCIVYIVAGIDDPL